MRANLIALAVGLGCGGGKEAKPVEQATTKPDAYVSKDPPTVAYDTPKTPALKLPSKTVDAAAVIWKTRAEVDRALGAGERRPDGKWKHSLGDAPQFVVITYENNRAVGIELMLAGVWNDLSDVERGQVAGWFHVKANDVNGRQVVMGASFLGAGLALYDKPYIDGLEAKVAAEAKKAEAKIAAEAKKAAQRAALGKATRESFVATLAGALSQTGFAFNVALGDPDTTLLVISDGCWSKLLEKLVEDAGRNMRNVGFTKLACSNGRASVEL